METSPERVRVRSRLESTDSADTWRGLRPGGQNQVSDSVQGVSTGRNVEVEVLPDAMVKVSPIAMWRHNQMQRWRLHRTQCVVSMWRFLRTQCGGPTDRNGASTHHNGSSTDRNGEGSTDRNPEIRVSIEVQYGKHSHCLGLLQNTRSGEEGHTKRICGEFH